MRRPTDMSRIAGAAAGAPKVVASGPDRHSINAAPRTPLTMDSALTTGVPRAKSMLRRTIATDSPSSLRPAAIVYTTSATAKVPKSFGVTIRTTIIVTRIPVSLVTTVFTKLQRIPCPSDRSRGRHPGSGDVSLDEPTMMVTSPSSQPTRGYPDVRHEPGVPRPDPV